MRCRELACIVYTAGGSKCRSGLQGVTPDASTPPPSTTVSFIFQSRTQLRSICEYRERSNPRLLHARVSHRRQKWDPRTWPKRLDVYRTGHGEQWGYCGSYTKFSLALLKR
jgi:hypothetical protein